MRQLRLPDLLDVLSGGVPNYYGPQRFGYGDDGVQRALEALQRRGRRNAQTFAVSVVQAALFNLWLGTRIQDGHFSKVVCGDVLKKRDTGGLFTNEDPSLDQGRMDRGGGFNGTYVRTEDARCSGFGWAPRRRHPSY